MGHFLKPDSLLAHDVIVPRWLIVVVAFVLTVGGAGFGLGRTFNTSVATLHAMALTDTLIMRHSDAQDSHLAKLDSAAALIRGMAKLECRKITGDEALFTDLPCDALLREVRAVQRDHGSPGAPGHGGAGSR